MAIIYKDNQYMTKCNSFFPESVKIEGDFLVGSRSTFWKNLVVTGNLYLCPECQIKGDVTCHGGIISRGCCIEGELRVFDGDLTLCDGAQMGKVVSQGNILIRQGVIAREIYGDMILVAGKIQCSKLMGKKTRVVSSDSP